VATIVVEALSKHYGELRAADEVSFTVEPGEIFGLLGPNGAGKTTTLRMLATLLRPSSGTAWIDGHDVVAEPLAARTALGFITAQTALYHRLSPREFLGYMARLHGLGRSEIEPRVAEAIDRFGIAPFADRACGALSTGQRQRVALARTSLHRPPALILDEPTAGLDVLGATAVVDFARASRHQGSALLLSTHDMAEAEYLCDRVAIIRHGRIVATGTPTELRAASGAEKLVEAFLHYVGEKEAGVEEKP
jgi:sodium transport system ATP-binding protein